MTPKTARHTEPAPTHSALEDILALARQVAGAPSAEIRLSDAVLGALQPEALDVGPGLPTLPVVVDDVFVVPDARLDPRFCTETAVLAGLRFWSAVALRDSRGRVLGTLHVLDMEPHTLDTAQLDALRALGRLAAVELVLRCCLAEAREPRDPVGEPMTMAEAERQVIARVVAHCHGNLSRTARLLGIGRTTVCRKVKLYGIDLGRPPRPPRQRIERKAIAKALRRHHGRLMDAAQLLRVSPRTVYRTLKHYGIGPPRRRRP